MVWLCGVLSLGLLSLVGGFGMLCGLCLGLVGLMVILGLGGCSLWVSLMGVFLIDGVSLLMVFLVFVVFYISLVSSVNDYKLGMNYLSGIESSVFLVSLFSGLFFFIGGWMNLFFLYEMSLVPTLWLILKWGYQPERLQAGLMFMVYAVCSSLPMMVSLVCMSVSLFSDSFLLVFLFGLGQEFCNGHFWVWLCVFMAFLVKVPVFIVHSWLPKAHVEAPLSASMILAGVLLKLGVFGLIRFVWVLEVEISKLLVFLVIFSVWGGVISSIVCVCQNDLKSLVAYSSVGHMSFCVGGVFSLTELGEVAAIVILFAHGICSPCLFSLVACSYDMTESRSVVLNKGLMKIFPLVSGFWFVMCVANMSCPPSLNFFGEVFSISGILGVGMGAIVALVLMCFLAGVYCLFLYSVVNHGSVSLMGKSVYGYGERYIYNWAFCFCIIFMGFFFLDYFLV